MTLLATQTGNEFVLQVTERQPGKLESKLVELKPFATSEELLAYARANYPLQPMRFVLPGPKRRQSLAGKILEAVGV